MATKPSVRSKTNYFLRYRIAMWVCLFSLGVTLASISIFVYTVFSEKLTILDVILTLVIPGVLIFPIVYFWKQTVDFKNKSNWYYLFNDGKIEIPVNIIYTKPRLNK